METISMIRDSIAGEPGSNLQTLHKFLSTVLLVVTGYYLLKFVNDDANTDGILTCYPEIFGKPLLTTFLVIVHLMILLQIWSSSEPAMVFNNLVFVLFLMITTIIGVSLFEAGAEQDDDKLRNYLVFVFLAFVTSLYSCSKKKVTGCFSVGLVFLLFTRGLEKLMMYKLQKSVPRLPVSTRSAR